MIIARKEPAPSRIFVNLANVYPSLCDRAALPKVLKDSDFGPETWTGRCFNELDFIPFERLSCRYGLKVLGIDNFDILAEGKTKLQWGSFVYIKTFLFSFL